MMEDAIDDWILRQIHWLRNDEVIAQGIRWVHNVRRIQLVLHTELCKETLLCETKVQLET